MTFFEELQIWRPRPRGDYIAVEKSDDSAIAAEEGTGMLSEHRGNSMMQHVFHLLWALTTFTLAFLLVLSTWQNSMQRKSSYEAGFATDFGT
jgi:heme A synthase